MMSSNAINNSGGNASPRFLGPKTKTDSVTKVIAQLPFVCFTPEEDATAKAVADTFHRTGNGKPAIDFFKEQDKALTTPSKRKSTAKAGTSRKSARTSTRGNPTPQTN